MMHKKINNYLGHASHNHNCSNCNCTDCNGNSMNNLQGLHSSHPVIDPMVISAIGDPVPGGTLPGGILPGGPTPGEIWNPDYIPPEPKPMDPIFTRETPETEEAGIIPEPVGKAITAFQAIGLIALMTGAATLFINQMQKR